MRILALQDSAPYGAITGGGLRNAANLAALRNVGDVTLLAMRQKPDVAIPDWLDTRYLARESSQFIWKFGSVQRPLSYRFSRDETRQISELIRELKPDLAVVEGVMLRDALPLLKAAGVPVILDMHNIESNLLAEKIKQSPARFWPGNYWRNLIKPGTARREDQDAAKLADQVWVCSGQDVELLRALSGINAQIVGNPVPNPAAFNLPITKARYSTARLIYIALMVYLPNRRAIETLCRKIAPKLPETAEMTFVGAKSSGPQRKMIAAAKATFVDAPPDVLPFLAAAGYSIMPITVGGGTRIKAIEALAAGVVIIATRKAVEGIGLQNGVHYLNAETPDESLAQLNACLENPDLPLSLAQNGRRFVMEKFSQEAIGSAVSGAIQSLTNR